MAGQSKGARLGFGKGFYKPQDQDQSQTRNTDMQRRILKRQFCQKHFQEIVTERRNL